MNFDQALFDIKLYFDISKPSPLSVMYHFIINSAHNNKINYEVVNKDALYYPNSITSIKIFKDQYCSILHLKKDDESHFITCLVEIVKPYKTQLFNETIKLDVSWYIELILKMLDEVLIYGVETNEAYIEKINLELHSLASKFYPRIENFV